MARNETVESATVAVHHMHDVLQIGVVGGAQSLHYGLDDARRNAVGKQHHQSRHDYERENATPRAVARQECQQHNDDECRGKLPRNQPHQMVGVGAVPAVERAEQFGIKLLQVFKHISQIFLTSTELIHAGSWCADSTLYQTTTGLPAVTTESAMLTFVPPLSLKATSFSDGA